MNPTNAKQRNQVHKLKRESARLVESDRTMTATMSGLEVVVVTLSDSVKATHTGN
jgi:ribosomal protein S8